MGAQEKSKRETLRDKVVALVKDFVTKEGNLSLADIMYAIDDAKNALDIAPISFSLKG